MSQQPGREDHERHPEQHQTGQGRTGDREHDDAADHQNARTQHHGQGRADHDLEQRRIAGQARDDLADARRLEEADIERQHPIEDALADIRDHSLADPVEQIAAHPDGDAGRQDHAQKQHQCPVQCLGRAAGQARIHQGADYLTEGEHRAGRNEERRHGPRQLPTIGPGETKQPAQGSKVTRRGTVVGCCSLLAHRGDLVGTTAGILRWISRGSVPEHPQLGHA